MQTLTAPRLLSVEEILELLTPEFAEFFTPGGGGGLPFHLFRHPLYYDVTMMGTELEIQRALISVAKKSELVEQCNKEERFSSVIFLHERPWRLNAFIRFGPGFLEHPTPRKLRTYWKLFGEIWTDSENHWQALDDWKGLLRVLDSRPIMTRHVMLPEERAWLKELQEGGENIELFRGVNPDHETTRNPGISWTTNLETARWFSSRLSRKDRPSVFKTTVPTDQLLLAFTRRNESELVIKPSFKLKAKRV